MQVTKKVFSHALMNAVLSDFKEALGIPRVHRKRQSTKKDSASEQTLIEFDQGDNKPKG